MWLARRQPPRWAQWGEPLLPARLHHSPAAAAAARGRPIEPRRLTGAGPSACCTQVAAPPPVTPATLPGTPASASAFPLSAEQLIEKAKQVRGACECRPVAARLR